MGVLERRGVKGESLKIGKVGIIPPLKSSFRGKALDLLTYN